MARTGKVEPQFGWQNQAEHLALTHTPMGVAAMTLAKKARGRALASAHLSGASGENRPCDAELSPLHGRPLNEYTPASATELQAQLARQKLAARQMRERIEALSRRVEDADNRYADLEDELNVAREEILLQQNDKHALQGSRDLLAGENAELTRRIAESSAALEQARGRIEHGKAALAAAKLMQNSLSAAVDEARAKQETADNKLDAVELECRKLTAALSALHRKQQIEGNNLKAAKIERARLLTVLDKANQKNQAHNQKLKTLQLERDRLAAALNKTNERHLAETNRLKSSLEAATSRAATAENLVAKVRDVLLEKFTQLQASVETRNCELHDLERSRLRLIDGTKMLLEIFAMRDVALARADARIRFLTDRIAELEADAYRSRAWRELEAVNGACNVLAHEPAADGADREDANSHDDPADASGTAESPRSYLAATMLAATISF